MDTTPIRDRSADTPEFAAVIASALALAADLGRLARLEVLLAVRASFLLLWLLPLLALFALGTWLSLVATVWHLALTLGAASAVAAALLLGVHALALALAWRALRGCWQVASLPRLRASLGELLAGPAQ